VLQVIAWAAANGVSLMLYPAGKRKHLIAEEYVETHVVTAGVFLILAAKAPAAVWEVRRSARGASPRASSRSASTPATRPMRDRSARADRDRTERREHYGQLSGCLEKSWPGSSSTGKADSASANRCGQPGERLQPAARRITILVRLA